MQKGHSPKKRNVLAVGAHHAPGLCGSGFGRFTRPVLAGKHAFYFEERTLERGKRIKAAAARHVGKFWTLRRRQGIDDGARLRDAELIHEVVKRLADVAVEHGGEIGAVDVHLLREVGEREFGVEIRLALFHEAKKFLRQGRFVRRWCLCGAVFGRKAGEFWCFGGFCRL